MNHAGGDRELGRSDRARELRRHRARRRPRSPSTGTPSTDDVGVTGYRVFVNGAPTGRPPRRTYTFTGLSCSTSYRSASRRSTAPATLHRARSKPGRRRSAAPGWLVAAYGFDEGSGAAAARRVRQRPHRDDLRRQLGSGPQRRRAHFDGSNDSVGLGSLGTFSQSGFTLEAWVNKRARPKKDVAVVGTGPAAGRCSGSTISPAATTSRSPAASATTSTPAQPVAGEWQHVAATYDGTTARFYIDGTQVASRAVAGSVGGSDTWRIGAYGSRPGGFFDGLDRRVRIYNRALSAAEIQTDMNQPPSRRRRHDAAERARHPDRDGRLGKSALTWGAASDDVASRATTSTGRHLRLHAEPGEQDRAADRHDYTDTGLRRRHLLLQGHRRGRRLATSGPPSNEASAVVTGDTTPPTVS